jgi:hypothetical protein
MAGVAAAMAALSCSIGAASTLRRHRRLDDEEYEEATSGEIKRGPSIEEQQKAAAEERDKVFLAWNHERGFEEDRRFAGL